MNNHDENVPVLIVGGSIVGLSMALFLSAHNIPTLLVERHPDISVHPRADGFNARTLELLRSVGVEPTIRETEARLVSYNSIQEVESLAGQEYKLITGNANLQLCDISPVTGSWLSQRDLEQIIRKHAEAMGASMLFNTELISFEQHIDGLIATIKDRGSGEECRIQAHYLVAADGNQSFVRRCLGITMQGYGFLHQLASISFSADLHNVLRGRKTAFLVRNPRVRGLLIIENYPEEPARFLGVIYKPAPGEPANEFTEARSIELVRAAVGIPDLQVKIVDVSVYKLTSEIAEHFHRGRVFLVGDAAHVMPPLGGFGANTGIQDAHNLAWKLALVLNNVGGSELLATYDVERRPVADFMVEILTAPYVEHGIPLFFNKRTASIMRYFTLVFGYRYHSAAICSSGDDVEDLYEDPQHPTGVPGTRAPHVSLSKDNSQTISTLDLFGKNFVLLIAADGSCWQSAALDIKIRLGLELDVYCIGDQGDFVDTTGLFLTAFGLTSTGATLIRPDGFVAWRAVTAPNAPASLLEQALLQILCRKGSRLENS